MNANHLHRIPDKLAKTKEDRFANNQRRKKKRTKSNMAVSPWFEFLMLLLLQATAHLKHFGPFSKRRNNQREVILSIWPLHYFSPQCKQLSTATGSSPQYGFQKERRGVFPSKHANQNAHRKQEPPWLTKQSEKMRTAAAASFCTTSFFSFFHRGKEKLKWNDDDARPERKKCK